MFFFSFSFFFISISYLDRSDTLRKSLPIINGAAEIDHMAICVLSSSIVIQCAPINNMSMSERNERKVNDIKK